MVLLDADGVLQLLRSEIERVGGPMAFSKKTGVDRTMVHKMLKRQIGPSRRVIGALDLRAVYVPKRGRAPRSDVVVVEEDKRLLQIKGKLVRGTRAQVALLACLTSALGRVVPYEQLCRTIGHESSRDKHMHVLRQQMCRVRQLLTTHKTRCSIAVAAGVGYALCEVV